MEGLTVNKIYKEEVYKVIIRADLNDADYITEVTEIKGEDFKEVLPGILEIAYFYNMEHQFCKIPGALLEYIDLPRGDGDRECHTLDKLEILHIKDGVVEELEIDKDYINKNIPSILAERIYSDIKYRESITIESILDEDCYYIIGFDPELTFDELKGMSPKDIEEHLELLSIQYAKERGKALYILKEMIKKDEDK